MASPLDDVLRAIALARTPGFNFPGHYLRLWYEDSSPGQARLAIAGGAANTDVDGQVNVGALALLADMALAGSFRTAVGATARVATVSMGIQLTGAPRTGTLQATARFDGFLAGGREKQGLARAEVRSGETLVATAHGAFIMLAGAGATAQHPWPTHDWKADATIGEDALDAHERGVLDHARKALADGEPGFLARFWGYAPRKEGDGATCHAWNGPHIGNRVGHAQGGVTFGMACTTANAALGEGWSLVGANAWYIGPGIGETLLTRATIVHRGLSTAVVRSRIEDEQGRGVLEVMTSHVRNTGDRPAFA